MDDTLPLTPLLSRLPLTEPFTPAMARRVGVGRSCLDRMCRAGSVTRLLRGVYVAGDAERTGVRGRALRAAALCLVTRPDAVVVDRTAAWLYGVEVPLLHAETPPVEVLRPQRSGAKRSIRARRLIDRDVVCVDGVRVTTPLRTALDLGRTLAPDRAIAVLDQLLAGGLVSPAALLSELPRFTGHHGVAQLRALAALADGRAQHPAESVLRLRWCESSLPTPTPGFTVRLTDRLVRVALGVGEQRFAVVLTGSLGAHDLAALEEAGWWVVQVEPARALRSDAALLSGHLEREFHQQLLRLVG